MDIKTLRPLELQRSLRGISQQSPPSLTVSVAGTLFLACVIAYCKSLGSPGRTSVPGPPCAFRCKSWHFISDQAAQKCFNALDKHPAEVFLAFVLYGCKDRKRDTIRL